MEDNALTVRQALGVGGPVSKQFEGYTERKQQIKLAEAINEAYVDCKNLLAEAPTGIGKSLAGIVPAIVNNKRITLVATATKSLQEQYYRKDLPFLKKVFGDRLVYTMLKGRGNYVCLNKFEEYAPEAETHMNRSIKRQYDIMRDWLPNSEMCDMDELNFNVEGELRANVGSSSEDCLNKKCPYLSKCPFKTQKLKAANSNVILVNIDLFCTDLVVRNLHNASVLPPYDTVLVDEAHELEGIISKYIGFKLSENAFLNVAGSTTKLVNEAAKVATDLDEMNVRYESTQKKVEDQINKIKKSMKLFFLEFDYERDEKNPEQSFRLSADDMTETAQMYGKQALTMLEKLTDLLNGFDRFSCSEEWEEKCDGVIKQIDSIRERITKILNIKQYYYEYVYWVSYSKRGKPVIECAPIDVSEYMRDWLFARKKKGDLVLGDIKTVILMSATLTTNRSFDFIRQRLGVDKVYKDDILNNQTEEIILDSEFDYKHNALLYMPAGMPDASGMSKSKDAFSIQVANNIERLARVTKGRMLCLFTSYAEMDKVYKMVKGKLPYTMFNQSEHPKKELINMFKESTDSMLFATSSFWTGVSFEGETCSAVVMDRIPFPVPSEPIIEARIDKLKRDGRDWFGGYYLPMAILEMQQGFGRLIRTNTDMGVVMICDNRIITKPYGGKFLRSFPNTLRTSKFNKVEFFFEIVEKKREQYRRKGLIK